MLGLSAMNSVIYFLGAPYACDWMDSKERVDRLRQMHRYLLKKLEEYENRMVPEGLDIRKLEEAFDELDGYRFVLKKVA